MRVVSWRWLATIAAACVVVWFATAGLAAGAQLLTVLLLVVFPAAFSLQAGIADEVPDGISRLGVYGLLLTLPVVATGSIVPSMIAHTALDVIGGIFAQRLFRA